MTLKSMGISNILKVFLWAIIITTGLSFITMSVYVLNYDWFLKIYYFDWFLSTFFKLTFIMLVVIYLVWIFKVHKDIKQFYHQYPISPGGSLARIMIPFYNLYGIWNVYSTMYNYFKTTNGTMGLGLKLKFYIPFYYFLLYISQIINQVVSSENAGFIFGEGVDEAILLSYGADLALYIMFLLIVNVVTEALKTLANEENLGLDKDVPKVQHFDYVGEMLANRGSQT